MINYLTHWSWLDDGVLPALITVVRTCWIWPWLGLMQLGLSPEFPAAALSLWLVLLLPLVSFGLARWASLYSTIGAPTAGDKGAPSSTALRTGFNEKLSLWPRLSVGLAGIVFIVVIAWWQLYSNDFGLLNPAWLSGMSDSLIHWPDAYIPPAVLLIVTGLLLWLRGLLDSGMALTHDTIWSIFLMGIVMMVLYLITISLADLSRVNQLITSVLVMLAAGMGALAFSSVKITAGLDRALGFGVRQMDEGSGSSMAALQDESIPVINRYWFLSVGGAISILMLLGILLTLLIAPEILEVLLDGLWVVATFVGDIFFNILLFLAYVAAVIFFYLWQFIEPLVRRLMERFNLDPELLKNFQQEPAATPEAAEIVERAPVPDEYRWLGLLIFGFITLVVFALVIRRLSKTDTEFLDEDRESILSADLLQDQLNSIWDRLLSRFRGQDPNQPFMPLDGEETRRRIRAVYQALLTRATELGQPRLAALTPVEYEARLVQTPVSDSSIFTTYRAASDVTVGEEPTQVNDAESTNAESRMGNDDLGDDPDDESRKVSVIRQFYGQRFAPQLEVITAGYVAARYGNEAPSDKIATDVENAWKEIERGIMLDN